MPPAAQTPTAAPLIPESPTLELLRETAHTCRACPLYEHATQTVFGEGLVTALTVFVGEQPGDKEDLAGKPFVGPSGKLFDEALEAAGIDRTAAYVTNVVKHFKWEARGKRRLHLKPNVAEVRACRPWLEAELKIIKPRVLVALGATAAQAMFGKEFRVTQQRGQILETSPLAPRIMATVHPSSVLRAPDKETFLKERELFFRDLAVLGKALKEAPGVGGRQGV